jgi:sorbitol-specific phosphotransferase system component IIA
MTNGNINLSNENTNWLVVNGVANTITNRYNPNLISISTLTSFSNAVSVIDSPGITGALSNPGINYIIKGRPGNAAATNNDVIARTVFGAKATGGNILFAGDNFNTIRSAPNVANAFVAGQITWRIPQTHSNLAFPDTSTLAQFSFNQAGNFALGVGAPGSSGVVITTYGTQSGMIGNTAPATAMSVRRARGNADAALSVEPNDSLGDIIWNATYTANGAVGSQSTRIKAVVDSAYVANSSTVASGLQFVTVSSTNTLNTHDFYANGNVQFANVVNATTFVGNIASSNVTGLGNIATINLDGNASNFLDGTGNFVAAGGGTPNSIQNGNSIVQFSGLDGVLLISTDNIANAVEIGGRNLALYGANTGGANISKIDLINGALNWTLDNTQFSGGTPFGMTRYNTGFLDPLNYFTARGNAATPADVQTGDNAYSERVQVLYNGTTHGIFNGDVAVRSFSPSNTVATTYSITSADDQANSVFQVNFGTANVAGDITTTGNINVNSSNVIIGADGRLDYLRTFGSFTSNATQTSNGANTTNYMTLNNTEDANGISIASSTQITVARTGRYNIQFSAQLEKTDSGSDIIEIWLDKNGTAVANTATQILLVGNNAKSVAAWDFNVNAANVNDYFRLAWASPDTDVQITAVPAANTISGVAIPSVIVDINPIGA